MKRYIKSESLVDTFLKYHDDAKNYNENPNGFDKMYSILEKYDDSNGNDSVDVAFLKATPEDQKKMIELITPEVKYNTREGAIKMYYDALAQDIKNAGPDYCDGVVDAIECLFESGWLNEYDFRTDL